MSSSSVRGLPGGPVLHNPLKPDAASSMLFDRDRLTSAVPSKWIEKGPMSMRSPGTNVVARVIGRPLTKVPLELSKSVITTRRPSTISKAWCRETWG